MYIEYIIELLYPLFIDFLNPIHPITLVNKDLYNLFNIKTIFGLQGILVAHILLNTPFAVRIFVQNLNSIPKKYVEVAKSMNYSFWQNYLYLEWPIIRQNFFSIFSIIFILCFLSFAIVMALGGGPRYSTLEVAIYQSIFFELDFNKAIILSIIQIVICSFLLIIGLFSTRLPSSSTLRSINKPA